MDHDVLELVQPAHVVVVTVRGHRHHRTFEQVGQLQAERRDPEARVDQEVAIAPADEVQVGPEERVDVRLGDPHDALVDRLVREPPLRYPHPDDAIRLTGRARPG